MKNKRNNYESDATNLLVEELTKMTKVIYERVIPTPFNFVYVNEFKENNFEEFQNNHYVDIRKHYNIIKEHGKNYINGEVNLFPVVDSNNWNNATYYLYKYIIDNIPFCCNYIELDYGKFHDKISFKDYTKALHNLAYIKNVDFTIKDNKWNITNLKLLAKTTVHGVYVVNHTVLSKCDKFFIGDVIREKYNDEYKIDGDGSIILEH